jgi:TP901 family phage tail tape measure protein
MMLTGLVKALANVAKENANQATTAQLAGAAYEVQSAGFSKTADTTKILEASLRGSVGGFSDVTTVSKAAISVLNAYGLGADQAAATIDKFTAVQQSGLITVDQYASQISRVAPVAAAAGVSLDQLNGFIATATASGVPVESTFSGLRQALASTIKPSAQATEEAKRLGIQFDATALRTKGLNGILADVKNSGLATGDSFSKLFGSIEAVAAIQPAINDLGKLEANIRASGESAGLTDKNFNKAKSSLKGFANEAQDALATLGERINQTANFNPLVLSARALVSAFQALPEPAQNIIAIVVGLGASFVAISAAITGTLAVVTPTIAAFKLLAGAIVEKTVAENASVAATTRSTAATVSQGVAQAATAIKTQASAIATGLYSLATTKVTGDLILTNAQLAIKNVQLGLVAARSAIAAGATAVYSGATNILTGSLTAATGAASALLIPLGLAAAAAGVLFAQIKANQIAESLDALNATGVGVKTLGDEAIRSATKAQTFSNQLKGLTADGKKASEQQINDAKNLVKANEERLKAIAEQENKIKNGGAIDETKGTRDAQLLDLNQSQNALKGQNDILKEQIKLNETNATASAKFGAAAQVNTEELKKQAIALKETQNQDAEKSIKRSFDDGKAKRDRENADAIKAIEETKRSQKRRVRSQASIRN